MGALCSYQPLLLAVFFMIMDLLLYNDQWLMIYCRIQTQCKMSPKKVL